MSQTRYGIAVVGDPPLLRNYAARLAMQVDSGADDFFGDVRRPNLPYALAGFARVELQHVDLEDGEMRVAYAAGPRYTVAGVAELAAAHPHLTIRIHASREYEWEVSFATVFRGGRQAEPWAMERDRVISGSCNGVVDLLCPERRVGAIVSYHHHVLGHRGEGQIVAVAADGELEIAPMGPIDDDSLRCLEDYGRPPDDPRFGQPGGSHRPRGGR